MLSFTILIASNCYDPTDVSDSLNCILQNLSPSFDEGGIQLKKDQYAEFKVLLALMNDIADLASDNQADDEVFHAIFHYESNIQKIIAIHRGLVVYFETAVKMIDHVPLGPDSPISAHIRQNIEELSNLINEQYKYIAAIKMFLQKLPNLPLENKHRKVWAHVF
jgi:hypothetical protein